MQYQREKMAKVRPATTPSRKTADQFQYQRQCIPRPWIGSFHPAPKVCPRQDPRPGGPDPASLVKENRTTHPNLVNSPFQVVGMKALQMEAFRPLCRLMFSPRNSLLMASRSVQHFLGLTILKTTCQCRNPLQGCLAQNLSPLWNTTRMKWSWAWMASPRQVKNLVRAEAALFLQKERFPQTEGAHWQVHLQKVAILDLYPPLRCLPENPVRR